MAIESVIGKTKVSPALIQTSAAREEAGFVAVEIFLFSIFIGVISSNFLVGFLLTFMVLLGLIESIFWEALSYFFSFLWGAAAFYVGYWLYDGSILTGLVAGVFVFGLMLVKHHWSLAYWRALGD